jgi:hypothetical protein
MQTLELKILDTLEKLYNDTQLQFVAMDDKASFPGNK